ncbi:MAG: hypothetical protein EBU42_04895 [Synechococcus sp.]|nr:hypothetical protein [Synechococcus sp.]
MKTGLLEVLSNRLQLLALQRPGTGLHHHPALGRVGAEGMQHRLTRISTRLPSAQLQPVGPARSGGRV